MPTLKVSFLNSHTEQRLEIVSCSFTVCSECGSFIVMYTVHECREIMLHVVASLQYSAYCYCRSQNWDYW